MFKHYLKIIKPGIIVGNLILVIGGFLFASQKTSFNFLLFLNTILGSILIIASACIFNNLIDFDIDKKMHRTRDRILSINLLSFLNILILAFVFGILGISILGILVNIISMSFSIFGFFVYVVLYTLFFKRKTVYSTFVGSFAGSTPSIIGYTAASNTIDMCATLLFIILIFWQMSHFYAISIVRLKDYQKANIPVFPVIKGVFKTKIHIFYYIIGFIISSSLLTFLGFASYNFLFLSCILNFYWLFLAYCNINNKNNKENTKKLFYFSIIVVVFFNILISIDCLF